MPDANPLPDVTPDDETSSPASTPPPDDAEQEEGTGEDQQVTGQPFEDQPLNE